MKKVEDSFIKVMCKENYYIHAAVCFGPGPDPILVFEKDKEYQYRLELYEHPNPEFRNVWHTVYKPDNKHGTNFSLREFQKYFESFER